MSPPTTRREKTHKPRARYQRLTPAMIAHIHHWLPPDAAATRIRAMAEANSLSYSTVWHVVRGYCRHEDAPWMEETATR